MNPQETALARLPDQAVQTMSPWNQERAELLRKTYGKNLSDVEMELFGLICQRTGLDAFSRQIYAIKRKGWNAEKNQAEDVVTFQTGIDGYRLISERTGKYEGQTIPHWCGEDGIWRDVWLAAEPPMAARVGVYKRGFREAMYGVAHYFEYVQTKSDGKPVAMWGKMAAGQLAKCAEALAHRKAFPQELSGLYTDDEMRQADQSNQAPDYKQDLAISAPAPKWANRKEMLAALESEFKRVGPEAFYGVLLEHGIEKGNDLKWPADAGKAELIHGILSHKAEVAYA